MDIRPQAGGIPGYGFTEGGAYEFTVPSPSVEQIVGKRTQLR